MALKQAFSTVDGVTDLLYVATSLNNTVPPTSFIPDMEGFIEPIYPGSLYSEFGYPSDYEFKELFTNYYDQVNNVWKDGDTGIVNADVKADVAAQLEALRLYAIEQEEYIINYNLQKEVQWRKIYAQALIDTCAS